MLALPSARLARELAQSALDAGLREGHLERIGYGAYLPPPGAHGSSSGASGASSGDEYAAARTRALARIDALARQSHADIVVSHTSAALLWGLTLWATPTTTHVTQRSRPGAERDRMVARHVRPLPPESITTIHGVPVTSLARTVVDCATLLPPLAGLVTADSACAAGVDQDEVAELLAASVGARHIRRARAVLAHADPGAESAYESASRFVVLRDGLPVPQTQVPVETHVGTVWSDWGWPEFRLLAEYDGEGKYMADPDGSFVAEKRRHDALQEAGHHVVRVTKHDLRGTALSTRLLLHLPPSVRHTLTPRRDLTT